MNNSNPFNSIGSPSAQTFAPNTIDGNGTCDRMMELTEREQAILVGARCTSSMNNYNPFK
ncbi:hypothetical protein [Coleofasciculus chthonoplastes]|uniref:hypothetical protein n=1 Tax=Coleofasciculus chthonoplastes TaxID=64178 RepID=UPI0033037D29